LASELAHKMLLQQKAKGLNSFSYFYFEYVLSLYSAHRLIGIA
jgi:hypothetical protein